jgi:phosphatidylinositol glycan class V
MASRRGAIKFALFTRALFICAMILSSAIIPTFNAGDDVLTFDLRLRFPQQSVMNAQRDYFCSTQHACDMLPNVRNKETDSMNKMQDDPQEGKIVSNFYYFVLKPFVHWDSARFLNLAVNPKARHPQISQLPDFLCTEISPDETCEQKDNLNHNPFESSEQSHAFFPLFPLIIRYLALILTQILPKSIQPPTFEAMTVLSSLIWNIFCFVIATLALQHLTYTLVANHDNDGQKDSKKVGASSAKAVEIANTTAVIFCLNPASVFFSTCYSESSFSAFTFLGYALWESSLRVPKGRTIWKRISLACCSTICWMLASFTRSNGSFIVIFLFIHVCGKVARFYQESKGSELTRVFGTVTKACQLAIYNTIPAICIVAPVLYHDQRGKEFHCNIPNSSIRPLWCDAERFSLYAYVQRAHWNVGFLRYYELKQIPNFLLAFPILFLSTSAVILWIFRSWNDFRKQEESSSSILPMRIWKWAMFALASMDANNISTNRNSNTNHEHNDMLAPNMLAHYALLAGFTIIGLTVAHVQISTRMICSACPSLYWFMSALILDTSWARYGFYLVAYLGTFHVLGVILHVNSLPWT